MVGRGFQHPASVLGFHIFAQNSIHYALVRWRPPDRSMRLRIAAGLRPPRGPVHAPGPDFPDLSRERMIRSLDGVVPRIHPSAFVSEFAYVVGDVEIGEGSSVWPGAVVRADMGSVTIGRYTCVQDNSVVHGDADVVIGDNVVIGHRVVCHARNVGQRVLIGNGATINDGVEIGDDSVLASGTVVLDNMEIPSRSIVMGVPGRVRGEVESRHVELTKYYCDIYIHKAERYKRQGNLESERL